MQMRRRSPGLENRGHRGRIHLGLIFLEDWGSAQDFKQARIARSEAPRAFCLDFFNLESRSPGLPPNEGKLSQAGL